MPGLRSRWITACRWAKASAERVCWEMEEDFLGGEEPSAKSGAQVLAHQLLQDEEFSRRIELADVDDIHDVRVLEPRNGPRLGAEATADLLAVRELWFEKLEDYLGAGVWSLVRGKATPFPPLSRTAGWCSPLPICRSRCHCTDSEPRHHESRPERNRGNVTYIGDRSSSWGSLISSRLLSKSLLVHFSSSDDLSFNPSAFVSDAASDSESATRTVHHGSCVRDGDGDGVRGGLALRNARQEH